MDHRAPRSPDRELARGTLVRPFDVKVRSSSSYYLVSALAKSKLRRVELFREWALEHLAIDEGKAA